MLILNISVHCKEPVDDGAHDAVAGEDYPLELEKFSHMEPLNMTIEDVDWNAPDADITV